MSPPTEWARMLLLCRAFASMGEMIWHTIIALVLQCRPAQYLVVRTSAPQLEGIPSKIRRRLLFLSSSLPPSLLFLLSPQLCKCPLTFLFVPFILSCLSTITYFFYLIPAIKFYRKKQMSAGKFPYIFLILCRNYVKERMWPFFYCVFFLLFLGVEEKRIGRKRFWSSYG